MAYVKQTWVDGSTGGTPLSAARLNHMEDGIGLEPVAADIIDSTTTGQALITAVDAPTALSVLGAVAGTGITSVVAISQTNYTNLATKDPATLYVITS